ncbi:hypothetical protein PCANC_20492 [Puccinia coronata f. sp. avenae]|uniref:Uncharacterized protein n=1 Tax=Puccinia coronata f. sp. avenae TaxID=200324 RepID=A0A2N5SQ52_9BASI|nr:hypothetical protein PCANC_20492 [Puccinia coronata f. sp. avenae]
MSDKPVRQVCPTWDRTILSDAMSNKPGSMGLSDMAPLKKTHPVGLSDTASDRIVQCYVGQAKPTILSDMGLDHSVRSHAGQGCLTDFFNVGLDNVLDPMSNNHCPMSS